MAAEPVRTPAIFDTPRGPVMLVECPTCRTCWESAPPTRVTWTLSQRLAQQPATLATVIASGITALYTQADTLPHPWNHYATIVLVIVAILAAIKLKT